jgi:beta-galactosidase/beta-glucuronidase
MFMSLKSYAISFLVILFTFISSAQTTVEKVGEEWVLKVDNQSFDIKGATFGYDDNVDKYDDYFQELNFLGVNTIRTWGTGENTKQLLDSAEKHNIKVMLGIWMRHGRPGMEADDSFNYLVDKAGMEAMYNNAIEIVENYKNHPAILLWGVGNEVYLNTATDEEKIAYSKLLERICSQIKSHDPNHPIASVEAWTFG